MSCVRKHFWTVVRSRAGGGSRPRKYGIRGCMPAVVSSVERSHAGGIKGAEGWNTWPFDSKNARNPARSSALVRMAWIVGAASGGSSAGAADLLPLILFAGDLL